MPAKRLITEKQRQNLINSKKFKGTSIVAMNQKEKDELLEIVAKTLGLF